MEDKILKQIESEALKLFPLDEYDDELFSERYNWRNGAKFGYNIKESVDEKLVCDIQKYLKDDVDLGFLKKKDVERINYYLDTFFKSKSATKNTESNEGEKWVRVEDRLPERLNYCVEVDRGA